MAEVSEGQFAALKQIVEGVGNRLDEFISEVRPLVLARSGELAMLGILQRDVDTAHRKHREAEARFERIDRDIQDVKSDSAARMQRIEDRQNHIFWMLVGAGALLEIIGKALPDGLFAKLFGG